MSKTYKDLQSFFKTKERATMINESKRILESWKDELATNEDFNDFKIPQRLWEQASLMLENSKKQLISEGHNTQVGTEVAGAGLTGAFGNLHSLVIPLVKRLVGKSVMIRDFVETQTLLTPNGIAYAMRFLKGEIGDGQFNRLNELNAPKNNRQSLGGFKLQFIAEWDDTEVGNVYGTNDVALNTVVKAQIVDDIQADFVTTGLGTATATITLPAVYFKRLDSFTDSTGQVFTFDATPWNSVSIANYVGANETALLSTRLITKLNNVSTAEMGNWIVGDLCRSGIAMDISYAQIQEGWKKDKYGEGIYTDADNELKAKGYNGTTRTGRHSKIKIGIDTESVEAESRTVWVDYAEDMADDLKTVQNISLKDVFVEQIEAQLIDEVDRDLLESMRGLAVDTTKGGADLFLQDIVGSDDITGRWMGEKLATMLQVITLMGEDIYRASRVGRGNFGIVTPTVASAILTTPAMFSGIEVEDERSDEGAYIGKIGKVSFYEDMWGEFNTGSDWEDYSEIFVGYKGKQQGHTGVIFCPYRTASMTEARNPETHNPSIKIKMRYGIMENLLDSGAYYRGGVISGLRGALGIA